MNTSAISSSPDPVDPSTVQGAAQVKVMKLSQDQQKAQGQAALQLIQSSETAPPASADGRGQLFNRYA